MKKTLKIITIVLCLLIAIACSFFLYESRDTTNATPENITQILEKAADLGRFGGFAVAVFNADSVFYSHGFGYQNVQKKIPYTTKTLQRVASVSKTNIGIALMKAQELGLLKITDPINEHLPFVVENPHFPDQPITIEHLATHTSSMNYNEAVVESIYIKDVDKQASLAAFMNSYFVKGGDLYAADYWLNQAPGTYYEYSNIAAALAAYIIEYTSGMSFAAFTKKYIYEPLDLENTAWFANELNPNLLATNYVMDEERNLHPSEKEGVTLYPVRDMTTNIGDLMKYCQAMIAKGKRSDLAVLQPLSHQSLLANKLSTEVANQAYKAHGLFNYVNMNVNGVPLNLQGHTGGDDCLYTNMFFDPKTDMGYIFMANTGPADGNHGMRVFVYQTLHSLGKHILKEAKKDSLVEYLAYAWHDASSRILAPFD